MRARNRRIPVGLLEGGKVTAPVKKGELLTPANATPDTTSALRPAPLAGRDAGFGLKIFAPTKKARIDDPGL